MQSDQRRCGRVLTPVLALHSCRLFWPDIRVPDACADCMGDWASHRMKSLTAGSGGQGENYKGEGKSPLSDFKLHFSPFCTPPTSPLPKLASLYSRLLCPPIPAPAPSHLCTHLSSRRHGRDKMTMTTARTAYPNKNEESVLNFSICGSKAAARQPLSQRGCLSRPRMSLPIRVQA